MQTCAAGLSALPSDLLSPPRTRNRAIRRAVIETLEQRALMSSSIWSSATTPAVTSFNDTAAVEVGVRFRSDQAGVISGIRFYKGADNVGQHLGSLWTSAGALLGQVTFSNESAI